MGFAEAKEYLVLLESEEFDGALGRLSKQWGQNAFVEGPEPFGADHLAKTIEDGRIPHVHRVGSLDLKPGFDEIQRMHEGDLDEPRTSSRRKLAQALK